jgi:uncharacterized cupin superfamily protein
MGESVREPRHPLITAAARAELPEDVFVHPLNANAVRHSKALAAAVGCIHLGVHWVRVTPGVSSVWGKGQSEMLAPKEKGHQSGHWPKPA